MSGLRVRIRLAHGGPRKRFTNSLLKQNRLQEVVALEVLLYGSLAKTGKGHGTDIAIQLGLSGEDPVTFDVEQITAKMNDIMDMKKLVLHGLHEIDFDPREDIEFWYRKAYRIIQMQ